jgi:hypothetical protein
MGKRKEFLKEKLSIYFKEDSRYIIDVLDYYKEIRFKVIKNAINFNLRSLSKDDKVTIQIVCIWIKNYIEFVELNKQKI